jgi:hypothetical protein
MKRLSPFIMLILSIILAACNLPTAPTQPVEGLSSTLAAQTLQAMLTGDARGSTRTPSPATPTSQPQQSTSTPIPPSTNTPAPSATATEVPPPCDAAGFITDVSVPDGTSFPGSVKFIKTWRLKNMGVCTWTTSYAVVFIDGVAMGSPASFNLPGSVPPGQTVDISIELTTPSGTGSYRANFKLRNPAGAVFGTGSSRSAPFYVEIKVSAPVSTDGGYSLVDNYCAAEWSSAAGTISCPAKDGDSGGFVIRTEKPNLETGQIDDEPGLITAPQAVNDGVIRGKYPPLTIKNGDIFRSVVGCEYKASNCNVKFQLDYQVDNGSIQTLASWNEIYDDAFTAVNVDLSSLAGKNVRLILTILANGSAAGDRALWLKPRIERVPPTPTKAP